MRKLNEIIREAEENIDYYLASSVVYVKKSLILMSNSKEKCANIKKSISYIADALNMHDRTLDIIGINEPPQGILLTSKKYYFFIIGMMGSFYFIVITEKKGNPWLTLMVSKKLGKEVKEFLKKVLSI